MEDGFGRRVKYSPPCTPWERIVLVLRGLIERVGRFLRLVGGILFLWMFLAMLIGGVFLLPRSGSIDWGEAAVNYFVTVGVIATCIAVGQGLLKLLDPSMPMTNLKAEPDTKPKPLKAAHAEMAKDRVEQEREAKKKAKKKARRQAGQQARERMPQSSENDEDEQLDTVNDLE